MHYHISEFFRKKSDGKLWVAIYPVATFTASDLPDFRQKSNGEVRQVGVYVNGEAFASSQLSALQAQLVTARDEKENLFSVFHADMDSLTLANLPNLAALTASKVQVALGEDGNFHQSVYSDSQSYLSGNKVKWLNKTFVAVRSSTGEAVYNTDYFTEVSLNLPDLTGYSVSTLGTILGSLAFAKVNLNIANPEQFPLTEGNILSEAGFATGNLYKEQSQALRNQLNDYHYTYLRVFAGTSGVFFNDDYTAIARSDDYATAENNRTMDKAERNVYAALVPKIAGDITLNSDGTLSQASINEYHQVVAAELEFMKADGEISDYEVEIDQSQDILQTSTLEITMRIIPKGKARYIVVNNSYAVKLSA
jgi:hypothetical protein